MAGATDWCGAWFGGSTLLMRLLMVLTSHDLMFAKAANPGGRSRPIIMLDEWRYRPRSED